MKKYHYLFHFIAYNIARFSCLVLATLDYAWLNSFIALICVLVQICWQYLIQHHTRGMWLFLGLITVICSLLDSLFIAGGIIIYAANPFAPYFTAPWMIALWLSFAVYLYTTLDRLFNNLPLLGLLTFLSFTVAYAVGAKIGAAFFPYGYKTCFFIGGFWFLGIPFIVYLYKKIRGIK